MRADKLKLGAVYFVISYEDDTLRIPILRTYEYMGTDIYEPSSSPEHVLYFFRIIGTEGTLELQERNLDLILDTPGVIEALAAWGSKESGSKP